MYDAVENRVTDIITLPGISNVPAFHVSGVQVDKRHDKLTISANAGAAFDTQGVDISGTNLIVQYDLATGRIEWQKNLTAVSRGVFGGFQDMEHDAAGNSFVLGTYPSSIVKISADGKTAEPWFVERGVNQTVSGFQGIAAFDDGASLLVSDGQRGQLLRFDTAADKGEPVRVPLQDGAEPIGGVLDGAYLPALYKDTVLLVSDNALGTVVLRSQDNWQTAERVGVVAKDPGFPDGFATATVQIADRIYGVTEFFLDNAPPRSLNRTEFPLYDITDAVNELLV